jgi:hypothetical protein
MSLIGEFKDYMAKKPSNDSNNNVLVKVPEDKKIGVFANVFNISTNNDDATINFICSHSEDEAYLASRVKVTKKGLEALQELLANTIENLKKIKK